MVQKSQKTTWDVENPVNNRGTKLPNLNWCVTGTPDFWLPSTVALEAWDLSDLSTMPGSL